MMDLSKLQNNDKDPSEPFGKIQYMALNAKKDIIAFYCESEVKGRVIVLRSDLTKEMTRNDTKLVEAKSLGWCGNDAPVLAYPDKIIIVGPKQFEIIDMRTKTAGLKLFTEMDSMRVVSSEKTYLFERVQVNMTKTFKIASTTSAAKLSFNNIRYILIDYHLYRLLNAMKAVDLNIPRADEIIRDVGDKVVEGIECLLDAASCEHQNI